VLSRKQLGRFVSVKRLHVFHLPRPKQQRYLRDKTLVTQRFPLNQDTWRTLQRYVKSHRHFRPVQPYSPPSLRPINH
jgi:hypothetical protein